MAAERWERRYFADNGTAYRVLVPVAWLNVFTQQWDDGGEADAILPQGIVMRYVNLRTADRTRRRNFPCSRPWSQHLPAPGSTCVLPNLDGTSTTWTVVGHTSEKFQPKKYRQKRR